MTKELAVAWKKKLVERGYAVRSINSMLASLNSFLGFMGWHDCRVKNIRLQHQTYCAEGKELTKAECLRLLEASKKKEQLNLVIQTICGTGIRVSELQYFTVEAVKCGEITVSRKSKIRTILVPGKLRKLLLNYTRKRHIKAGTICVGKNGPPRPKQYLAADEAALQGYRGAGIQGVSPQPEETVRTDHLWN